MIVPHSCVRAFPFLLVLSLVLLLENSLVADELLEGHPRESYREVDNIEAMEAAVRKSFASIERHSFSRGWWKWDRLRARFVDEGRQDRNALRILRAVFVGLILDRHDRLKAKGEEELLYLFFSTNQGTKNERKTPDGRKLIRDVHGGGYHGGWGGAARMRIYRELVEQGMLTESQQEQVRSIVHQSFSQHFLDFTKGAQTANNHSFGNAGGIALALKLFPDVPQADAAKAWLDRIWNHLSDFGDWKEWTYYPYGPIFLHGVIDVAEATDRLESDRDLMLALGNRVLGFVHGSGVRGNPNSGARGRSDLKPVYADPWHVGYYNVETSSRDGHFWYRLAQHYRHPEFLWAAEQVALGGRPPSGDVPNRYKDAYSRRFAWFIKQGIKPQVPRSRAAIGFLSAQKHRIPERLMLHHGRASGKPFAGFFLYEKKDAHLDNVSGHLFEYTARGAKLLHSSGKYNNVYSGNNLKGGGTGEESLDLFLVVHRRHPFPLHPDRQGDKRDFMRRGSLKLLQESLKTENNERGDSFGRFSYTDYCGPKSRWKRSTVLTREGVLIVADEYQPAASIGQDYHGGPVWHLAAEKVEGKPSNAKGKPDYSTRQNWFTAPSYDQAWWQTERIRVLLTFHHHSGQTYGRVQQAHSQDSDPNVTVFAYAKTESQKPVRFLSVLVPYVGSTSPGTIRQAISTQQSETGWVARIGNTTIQLGQDDKWNVDVSGSK